MVAFLVAFLSLSGCSTQLTSEFPKNSTDQFDIVFVSIDTLRSDHLSCYGYERETSPFIDSLAKNGVRFEHARSASPWTLPAHTTMFTGQLPATPVPPVQAEKVGARRDTNRAPGAATSRLSANQARAWRTRQIQSHDLARVRPTRVPGS